MNMHFKFIAALAITVFFGKNVFAQDEHVALLKKMSGDIRIVRNNVDIAGTPGLQLMKMDTLVSGPKSSAGLIFIDGTALAVGASSELELSRYVFRPEESKYDFSVALKKGQAIYTSGRLAKLSPQSVSVNTPRATVGVRGTRFIIKSDE